MISTLLLLFGAGFLIANLRLLLQYLRYRRIRGTAVLTWRTPKPHYYGLLLAIGVVLGLLVFYKIAVQQREVIDAFGVGMMFVYYAYLLPLSLRIRRGFYADGLWDEYGFLPYSEIGGLTWRENGQVALVVSHRGREVARRLIVPQAAYGAARRLLRDRIASHDIHFTGKMLDLGAHDERDDV
jgi:hypothetical protein